MIKKIVLWLLALALLLLAVLFYVGYRTFNQEAFKNQVIQTVQDITGRQFKVNGAYQLTWDPLLTMTLENVSLSNLENSPNAEMFKADKVQIQIEWASLFTNPPRIKSIVITNPQVLVERISHSMTNLDFARLFKPQDAALESQTLLGQPKGQARIDNIRVENGTFQYINQITKQSFLLTKLTGEVVFASLSGPFSFKGSGMYRDLPLHIDTSFSKYETSKSITFLTEITPQNTQAHLKIDGQIYPEDLEKYFVGSLSFEAEKPNDILSKIQFPSFPEQSNKLTAGNASLEIGSSTTKLSDLIFKIGTEENAVAANINYTEAAETNSFTIDITTLDLDQWANTIRETANKNLLEDVSSQFNLNISNFTWNKQNATTLNLIGSISDNKIQVEKGSVLLAGPTTVQIKGLSGTNLQNWNGLAQIDIQSSNLKAALPFFKLPNIPFLNILSHVTKAEFSTAMEWDPEKFTLAIPTLSLDGTTGAAEFEKSQNQPLNISLELNKINFANYISNPTASNNTTYSFNQIFEKLVSYIEDPKLLTFPAHWDITLNNTLFKEMDFQNITIDATTSSQTFNLEAVASFQGQGSLTLKTDIENVGKKNWQIVNNMFELEGQNLPSILGRLGIESDNKFVQNARTFFVQGNLIGQPKQWQIEGLYKTQDFSINVIGPITDGDPEALVLQVNHSSMPHMFANLIDQNPFKQLTGTFDLEALVTKKDKTISFTNMSIQADSEQIQGQVTYNLDTKEFQADLTAQKADLAKLLPNIDHFYLSATGFDSNPFELDLLKNLKGSLSFEAKTLVYQATSLNNAKLHAHIDNNTLFLDDFIAASEDNEPSTIQARGSFNWAQTPVLNLKFVTQMLPIKTPLAMFDGIGITGGRLSSEWNLASTGETPLQMARSLTGSGKVVLDNATWIGADLSSMMSTIEQAKERDEPRTTFEPKLKHSLENGASAIKTLQGDFSIKDGLWQLAAGNVEMPQASTDGLTIDWDIPSHSIKAKAPLKITDLSSLPSFIISFIKDKRGVSYTSDISAFSAALSDEFAHDKQLKKEAAIQKKQEELANELDAAKTLAQQEFQKLTTQLTSAEKSLNTTPNIEAQKIFKTVLLVQQNLGPMLNGPTLSTTQYLYISDQAKKAQTDLTKVQNMLLSQEIEQMKKNNNELLKKANDLVSKQNEMYQKRPHISLLSDLFQNSELQRQVIQRAINQFNKNLSFEQAQTVTDIIQKAYAQIKQAHDYAEEIYSGRQSVPTGNIITKAIQ